MKLTQNQVLWGVILTAVAFAAGGVIAFNNAEADLTDSEVISIIESYLRSDEGQRIIEREILADNADFVDFKKEVMDAMAHPHQELISLDAFVQRTNTDVQQLKLDVAVLKAGGFNTGGGGGSTVSTDFDLELSHDINFVDVDNRFNQGETIYLKGNHNTNDKILEFEVRDPNGVRIDSGQASMTQGNFIWTYSIEDDADDGVYVITIEIDRNQDKINFIVD